MAGPQVRQVRLALGVFSLVETLNLGQRADSPLAVSHFVSLVGLRLEVVSNDLIDLLRDFCGRAAEPGLKRL